MTAGSPHADALYYRVPEGQDPVTVVTALRLAGFEVEQDAASTYGGQVVVTGAAARREDVRRVIAENATLNLEDDPAAGSGDVRFVDET